MRSCVLLVGALASQLIVGRVPEQTTFSSIMVLQSFLGALTQLLGVGAGGTLFLSSSLLIPALVLNAMLTNPGDDISLWSYAIGQITPLVTGSTLLYSVLDVFVPLVRKSVRSSCIRSWLISIVDRAHRRRGSIRVHHCHHCWHYILVHASSNRSFRAALQPPSLDSPCPLHVHGNRPGHGGVLYAFSI